MATTIERLEQARITLAQRIASCDDPTVFIPIFRRLDAEIAARKEANSYLEDIRRLASMHTQRDPQKVAS